MYHWIVIYRPSMSSSKYIRVKIDKTISCYVFNLHPMISMIFFLDNLIRTFIFHQWYTYRSDGFSFREIILLFRIKTKLTPGQKGFSIIKKTHSCFVQYKNMIDYSLLNIIVHLSNFIIKTCKKTVKFYRSWSFLSSPIEKMLTIDKLLFIW
jgi:hypothetical protein